MPRLRSAPLQLASSSPAPAQHRPSPTPTRLPANFRPAARAHQLTAPPPPTAYTSLPHIGRSARSKPPHFAARRPARAPSQRSHVCPPEAADRPSSPWPLGLPAPSSTSGLVPCLAAARPRPTSRSAASRARTTTAAYQQSAQRQPPAHSTSRQPPARLPAPPLLRARTRLGPPLTPSPSSQGTSLHRPAHTGNSRPNPGKAGLHPPGSI
jgi:hypothetical protein